MSIREAGHSMENLERAISRLEEALAEKEKNSLYVDGTIQRFELTFDLFWKTVKRLLEEEGIETKTPRETLKQAYAVGWLQNEYSWLQMLKDRNETSHVYDEERARQIYEHITDYFPDMKKTFEALKVRYMEREREEE